jgi:ABC-2 type transport system ATP-binding protein
MLASEEIEAMVSVKALHKSFGSVRAVRGVTFELVPGQIAGLLGHNGAGKTTTIRMIAGVLMPDEGSVSIAGVATSGSRARAMRSLGYLPESNPLYPEMRVREYIDFRARVACVERSRRRMYVEECAERCRVKEMLPRRIGTLSKGYRQRVGLAAAMVHKPAVLLLDEPTNGLDPGQVHETRELVRDLSQERTMLVSSHILPEVERLCDRVIIFAGGRVCADGTPADLSQRMGTDTVDVAAAGDAESLQRAEAALRTIAALTHSAHRSGEASWTLLSASQESRARIARAISDVGCDLLELTPRRPTLEQVFLHVTEDAGTRGQET